jgi:hypothetical protein
MTLRQIAIIRDKLKTADTPLLANYIETVLANADTKPHQVCEWLRYAITLIEETK